MGLPLKSSRRSHGQSIVFVTSAPNYTELPYMSPAAWADVATPSYATMADVSYDVPAWITTWAFRGECLAALPPIIASSGARKCTLAFQLALKVGLASQFPIRGIR